MYPTIAYINTNVSMKRYKTEHVKTVEQWNGTSPGCWVFIERLHLKTIVLSTCFYFVRWRELIK